ncbi:hypothetical protein K491DRAFT_673616 [Lophiostoma macrostomum CBS 122681]|uniref:Uncharacterized protein n=1 Tax=Lophiostoma macrostomum CBS 122681 TaxID=1314788 RepID=A0A6A6TR91_9PLEO|nr:hypothetical protein K491DRAFT_673616 [Lophiostoma macrostomum CBS 122681]
MSMARATTTLSHDITRDPTVIASTTVYKCATLRRSTTNPSDLISFDCYFTHMLFKFPAWSSSRSRIPVSSNPLEPGNPVVNERGLVPFHPSTLAPSPSLYEDLALAPNHHIEGIKNIKLQLHGLIRYKLERMGNGVLLSMLDSRRYARWTHSRSPGAESRMNVVEVAFQRIGALSLEPLSNGPVSSQKSNCAIHG